MGIISIIPLADTIHQYKAPRGKLFEVLNISSSAMIDANNAVIVTTRAYPPESTVITPADADIIYIHELDGAVSSNHSMEYIEPEVCKFISVGSRLTGSTQAGIIINYRFKEASKIDLLIEWFRKGI